MALIPESPVWKEELYRLETGDPALAGAVVLDTDDITPISGHVNAPIKTLANRTQWLKLQLGDISEALDTINGEVV
mgnify:CR=1 FL=1